MMFLLDTSVKTALILFFYLLLSVLLGFADWHGV
jgi:hypothetical protein